MPFINRINQNDTVYEILGNNDKHKNLLYNPWFLSNQRGFTSSPTELISLDDTVDLWFTGNQYSRVSIESDGIHLTYNGSNACILCQDILNYSEMFGKEMTLSILLADGRILSKSGTMPTTRPSDATSYLVISGYARVYIGPTTFQARLFAEQNITVRAIKLEFGNESTLKAEGMPNVELEELRCQNRLYVAKAVTGSFPTIGTGYIQSATNARITIELPTDFIGSAVSIKATPSAWRICTPTGGITPTAIEFQNISGRFLTLDVTIPSTTLTQNTICALRKFTANSIFELSCG